MDRLPALAKEVEMNENEAVEQLATIRRIMESATRMTTLPGKAAVCGGVFALIGCVVTYWKMRSLDFAEMANLLPEDCHALVAMWALIAIAGIGVNILLTLRLARKRGVDAWSRLAQLAAYAMAPALLAATALSVTLIENAQWRLVAPTWMMLYGVALWMAGILSVRAPRMLGGVFFAAGIATLFWAAPAALAMVALTFGLAHVVFGIYLISRFGE
jgi:hypothetical protein